MNKHKNCYSCEHCLYLGDGGYLCDMWLAIVVEDHEPTDDFYMCKGEDYLKK